MAIKNYFQPQSLDEAVSLLAEHGPSLLVMAGGTIAMPLINEGISLPEQVMGLRQADTDRSTREVPEGSTMTTLPSLVPAARALPSGDQAREESHEEPRSMVVLMDPFEAW